MNVDGYEFSKYRNEREELKVLYKTEIREWEGSVLVHGLCKVT
jgi:hypothetical protein